MESIVGRRSSESCEESLVEFIYTPTGGSRDTRVVLSRGVRQSRVRTVQDVSTSPVPVRRHSQSVSQFSTVVCPAGGVVPRRRSSNSVQSGRSRLCAKKEQKSLSTEYETGSGSLICGSPQHPPPLCELQRLSLAGRHAGFPLDSLRLSWSSAGLAATILISRRGSG